MIDLIHVKSYIGRTVATFIRLPDEKFFGGKTSDESTPLPSPHMVMNLASFLDYIGTIAQDGNHTLDSSNGFMTLTQDISAPELATVIGCRPMDIVSHFRLLVRVTE